MFLGHLISLFYGGVALNACTIQYMMNDVNMNRVNNRLSAAGVNDIPKFHLQT